MQNACAILSSVPCLALEYISTLPHKRNDFRKKKKLLNKKCVFLFPLHLLSEIFFSLRIIARDVIKNVYRFSRKVRFIPVRFE